MHSLLSGNIKWQLAVDYGLNRAMKISALPADVRIVSFGSPEPNVAES